MQRNRTELKGFYKKGAIPTQSNFEDLIDSVVVQQEDGLTKPPNDPLTLRGMGPEERVLLFSRLEQSTDRLTWIFKQRPSGAGRPGLSLGDATTTRLYIESETGNIGIGTLNPKGALHVAALGDAILLQPEKMGAGQVARIKFADPDNGTSPMSIEFRDNGTPALHLVGGSFNLTGGDLNVAPPGKLFFGSQVRQMINLWTSEYGIGIQSSTQYYRTGAHFAWFRGGEHNDAALSPGSGQTLMVLRNGNLGVGADDPQAKLDVNGSVRVGGSDLYFTEATHNHTGIGNTLGFAAIENAASHEGLMILGRTVTTSPLKRVVKMWDEVHIAGDVIIGGNIGSRGFSPKPKTGGWGGGVHTWDIEAEGTIWSRNGVQSGARDLAENYRSDLVLEPGEVVGLDPENDRIIRAERTHATRVIGVLSTRPGVLLGVTHDESEEPNAGTLYPVALMGCVPCRVSAENGPIARGDLLTPASKPGYAMKAKPAQWKGGDYYCPGTIIGKALAAHSEGEGMVDVFVTLR